MKERAFSKVWLNYCNTKFAPVEPSTCTADVDQNGRMPTNNASTSEKHQLANTHSHLGLSLSLSCPNCSSVCFPFLTYTYPLPQHSGISSDLKTFN